MNYIESPNTYSGPNKNTLFLAGGITGCPDWQSGIVDQLKDSAIIIFNPRRKKFPINNPDAAGEQIKWEFDHLRKAKTILFWFPMESICPIALYELGAWLMTPKQLFIGIHPYYKRKQDIQIQTAPIRPAIEIVYSLPKLSEQILKHIG